MRAAIAGLRSLAIAPAIEVKPHTQKRGTLLQGIGGRGLEVIGQGHHVARLAAPGDPAGSEVAFNDTARVELPDNNHLVGFLQDLMLGHGKGPLPIEGVIQPLNHAVSLDVVQHLAEVAFSLLDLAGVKGLFQEVTVHWGLLSVVVGAQRHVRTQKGRPAEDGGSPWVRGCELLETTGSEGQRVWLLQRGGGGMGGIKHERRVSPALILCHPSAIDRGKIST